MNFSPTGGAFRYRAFIAYSHHDEKWAKWLHKALENYRVPTRLVNSNISAPRRLTPIFRDRAELPSAPDLGRLVTEALEHSANLILICSPHSAVSTYVNEEVSIFRRLGRADRIFCLIVDGEPNASALPGRETEECFPSSLRLGFGEHQSSTDHREPIAADARKGKDGKTNAKIKLIAGILNVGFDVLKQREHRRHMERMAAVTSLAVLALLITAALAVDALIARKNAVVARDAAERRQRQAEALVNFMLGDLNDKLGQVKRLDILEATDNEAMKYFQSLPTTDVTDQALALRAKALQKIGSIRMAQGKLPAALESYRASSELAREIAERGPADSARQIAYANSFNWIGTAYWYQGDLDRSLENFDKSINLLKNQSLAMPLNSDLAADLASALTNAGRVLEARGDLVKSTMLYQSVEQTFETLSSRETGNVRWRSELGYAYNNLGKVALERGQLPQAVIDYAADQRIKAELAQKDPKNLDAQEDLLVADAILGRTVALCGLPDAAIRYASDALTLARNLVAIDAAHSYWQEDLGYYSESLGAILRQSGRLAEAAQHDHESVRILSDLVAADRTNARWRRELGIAQIETARLEIARSNYGAAQEQLGNALSTVRVNHAPAMADPALVLLMADADIVGGQIASGQGDLGAAHAYWTKARDAMLLPAQNTDDPNLIAVAVNALVRLSDLDAAQPLLNKLQGFGYQTGDLLALLATKNVSYRADPTVAQRVTSELFSDTSRE